MGDYELLSKIKSPARLRRACRRAFPLKYWRRRRRAVRASCQL